MLQIPAHPELLREDDCQQRRAQGPDPVIRRNERDGPLQPLDQLLQCRYGLRPAESQAAVHENEQEMVDRLVLPVGGRPRDRVGEQPSHGRQAIGGVIVLQAPHQRVRQPDEARRALRVVVG